MTDLSRQPQTGPSDTVETERAILESLLADASQLPRRFAGAPVMSVLKQWPGKGIVAPHYRSAVLVTQDDAAGLTFEVSGHSQNVETTVTFYLMAMLGLQFDLCGLTHARKRTWLDNMHRALAEKDNTPIFLWTDVRWRGDYLVFIVERAFVYIHAFSPRRRQAVARIVLSCAHELFEWFEAQWFPPA